MSELWVGGGGVKSFSCQPQLLSWVEGELGLWQCWNIIFIDWQTVNSFHFLNVIDEQIYSKRYPYFLFILLRTNVQHRFCCKEEQTGKVQASTLDLRARRKAMFPFNYCQTPIQSPDFGLGTRGWLCLFPCPKKNNKKNPHQNRRDGKKL